MRWCVLQSRCPPLAKLLEAFLTNFHNIDTAAQKFNAMKACSKVLTDTVVCVKEEEERRSDKDNLDMMKMTSLNNRSHLPVVPDDHTSSCSSTTNHTASTTALLTLIQAALGGKNVVQPTFPTFRANAALLNPQPSLLNLPGVLPPLSAQRQQISSHLVGLPPLLLNLSSSQTYTAKPFVKEVALKSALKKATRRTTDNKHTFKQKHSNRTAFQRQQQRRAPALAMSLPPRLPSLEPGTIWHNKNSPKEGKTTTK